MSKSDLKEYYIEILAQIYLRVIAKRQPGLIKPDSVDQDKLREISKRIDNPSSKKQTIR